MIFASLCMAWAVVATTPPPPATPEPAPTEATTATDETTARVILHTARQYSIAGHLLNTNATSVTIQTLDDQVKAIPLKRIQWVQWLLDPPEPIEVTIRMTKGHVLQGLLIRDGFDAIDVRVSGIDLTIDRNDVQTVTPIESVTDRYQRLKARYPVTHQQAHLRMCRWLVSEGAWEEAIEELNSHLGQHRSKQARHLHQVATARLQFRPAGSQDDAHISSEHDQGRALPTPISDEEVNLIRVYETDINDPPNMQISPAAREAFLADYGTSSLMPQTEGARAQFIEGPAVDVLALMFQLQAREHYPSVDIITEPPSLRRFRQHVHDAWVVPRCGMRACHGGPDAGRFMLYRSPRMNDRLRMSNLLILDELIVDDGPLIDWDRPADSVLLQYALPRDEATHPHPPVDGWRAVFPRINSGSMATSQRWIESMQRSPRPEYPIQSPISARQTPQEAQQTPQ